MVEQAKADVGSVLTAVSNLHDAAGAVLETRSSYNAQNDRIAEAVVFAINCDD